VVFTKLGLGTWSFGDGISTVSGEVQSYVGIEPGYKVKTIVHK
jgi:hypothetical protein